MKHSESITKLAAALVAAQGELRAVGMDAVNPHFKAKYASLDNIIETIRPTLARHKLAVVQGATLPESNAEGKVTGFTVETMLVHESGEWLLSGVVMPVAKADPQGAGAAITYGRRYGISALLSLATDEDDDGNRASQRSGGGSRTSGASGDARQTNATPSATRSTPPAVTRERVEEVFDAKAAPGEVVKPFGKGKGTAIKDLDPADLVSAVEWAKANKPGVYGEFIAAAEAFLADVAA